MKIVLWYKYGFCHVIVIFAYKSNYSASIWKTDSYKLNIGNYIQLVKKLVYKNSPSLGHCLPKPWALPPHRLGNVCPSLVPTVDPINFIKLLWLKLCTVATYKMKGFCCCFLKKSINVVIFIAFFVLLHLIKRIRV